MVGLRISGREVFGGTNCQEDEEDSSKTLKYSYSYGLNAIKIVPVFNAYYSGEMH